MKKREVNIIIFLSLAFLFANLSLVSSGAPAPHCNPSYTTIDEIALNLTDEYHIYSMRFKYFNFTNKMNNTLQNNKIFKDLNSELILDKFYVDAPCTIEFQNSWFEAILIYRLPKDKSNYNITYRVPIYFEFLENGSFYVYGYGNNINSSIIINDIKNKIYMIETNPRNLEFIKKIQPKEAEFDYNKGTIYDSKLNYRKFVECEMNYQKCTDFLLLNPKIITFYFQDNQFFLEDYYLPNSFEWENFPEIQDFLENISCTTKEENAYIRALTKIPEDCDYTGCGGADIVLFNTYKCRRNESINISEVIRINREDVNKPVNKTINREILVNKTEIKKEINIKYNFFRYFIILFLILIVLLVIYKFKKKFPKS